MVSVSLKEINVVLLLGLLKTHPFSLGRPPVEFQQPAKVLLANDLAGCFRRGLNNYYPAPDAPARWDNGQYIVRYNIAGEPRQKGAFGPGIRF